MFLLDFIDFLPLVAFLFGIVLLLLIMNHFSAADVVQYETEIDEEGCGQRAQMVLRSMDTMWTALGLYEMMEADKQKSGETTADNPPLDNSLVLISPSEFYLRSVYENRALRIIMVLNWETQKLFIRIEQSFESFIISVDDVVKLDGYELSLTQANKIANLYYKDLVKISRKVLKDAAKENKNGDN